MKRMSCLLAGCLMLVLAGPAALAMQGAAGGARLINPPVILSNESDQALIVTWQTSIPCLAASPVERIVLPAHTEEEHVNHANFWIAEESDDTDPRSVPNQIEIWVYAEDTPDLLVSHFVTYRNLYSSAFAERDKGVVLAITLSPSAGVDVRLETGS